MYRYVIKLISSAEVSIVIGFEIAPTSKSKDVINLSKGVHLSCKISEVSISQNIHTIPKNLSQFLNSDNIRRFIVEDIRRNI